MVGVLFVSGPITESFTGTSLKQVTQRGLRVHLKPLHVQERLNLPSYLLNKTFTLCYLFLICVCVCVCIGSFVLFSHYNQYKMETNVT